MAPPPWSVQFTRLPGGARLAYRRSGTGQNLVLLHGLLGTAAQWRGCADALAEEFTCWGLELAGMSLSDPVPDMTLPGLRAWLEAALAHLGIASFDFVGSSWGGALGLEFAAFSPQRRQLRRLALAAPVHPAWTPSRRQDWLLRPAVARLAAALGAHLPAGWYRGLLEPSYGDPARLSAASVEDYRAVLQSRRLGSTIAAYARDWRADQRRLEADLGAIAQPTRLLWGDRDRVVPPRSAATLQRALPGSELVFLPGLGHLPFEEDPAAFVAALRPFLEAA